MKKTNVMRVIIFCVVLLIPIIYSFFYLKSYWDPYGDLSGMKIALVNLDVGKDGENQGKEFLNGLKDDGTFNICEVSEEEAKKGMENGDYYATITLPKDFTECLNSASENDKQIAKITYTPNQATNYLATQIINSAVKTMELNLESKINSKIVENLADKLKEIPDSLQEISDGAGKILDGSEDLSSGLEQINEGTETLNNSYTEFDDGVNQAASGSKELEDGISKVDSGVSTLNDGAATLNSAIEQINDGANELSAKGSNGIVTLASGVKELNTGAKTLNAGVGEYIDGTNTFASGATSYIEGTESLVENVNTYIDGVSALNGNVEQLLTAMAAQGESADPTMQVLAAKAKGLLQSNAINNINTAGSKIKLGEAQLTSNDEELKNGAQQLIASGTVIKQGAGKLQEGTDTLVQGTSSLSAITDGIDSLRSALAQVQDGTNNLENGVSTLKNGTESLNTGSSSLTKGLDTLSESSELVKNALNTLRDGTNKAYEGSRDLVSGVKEFKTEIDKGIRDTKKDIEPLEDIEKFAENPVEFTTEAYGKVDSYGIAFTPLFLCIGLWVGALMLYVVLYYDQKNRFNIFGSESKNKIVQNIAYIAVGAVEGVITAVLLKVGLGFEVQDMGLYILASILIGITFISIIQFLIRNFGDVGKFIALIILVLQLAASGGTFPVETIDKGFQGLTNFLPMTYTIKLLREVLVPTATNFKGTYIGILVVISIVTVAITCGVDIIRNKKQKSLD